ncbi:NAD(P)H-hydrate epimerase [soil metagenome]
MSPLHLTCRQLRELDRRAIEEYGIPGPVLMKNAGRGAVENMQRWGIAGKVVICCGKGNNGGDGLVMARHLDAAGVEVEIILTSPPEQLSVDAALQYRIVKHAGIKLHLASPDQLKGDWFVDQLQHADWIVDALFGTGLTGPLRPPFDSAIKTINYSPARKLAVDIPSGLDGDLGVPLGETIWATHTVTFVALKTGFATVGAAAFLGKVEVVPIGLPRKLLELAHSI